MADALCGPSNALQNFQKHSTADRTLQQDRLATRPSPSQGFRSSPGPSAGHLDPEFEAFQAGQIPLPHPEAQQFHPVGAPNLYAPQQLNQPSPATWASDFQQLSISSPSAQIKQHNYAQQLKQQQLAARGWQNEFAKQQSQPVRPASSSNTSYNSSPFQRLSTIAPVAPLQGSYGMSYSTTASQGLLNQSQTQPTEAFDEEAFARAFDQAAESELAMEIAQQQLLGVDQDVLVNESAERLMSLDQVEEQPRLGADLIHDSREGERAQQQDDPDALARTAGQLLDSVKDNQSDKFQKSQFLELMRQLRDREVTVEGDKIVGVQSSENRDALEKSLLSIARQLSQLDLGRVEPLLASIMLPSNQYHRSVQDQLVIGAFVRTLMRVSAALENLLSIYPDLIQRSKPFGMSIGIEVFTLADHPLIDKYPALKALVLNFREQFLELGIHPQMLRRANEPRNSDKDGREAGDVKLQAWLSEWFASLGTRRSRGAEWMLSGEQIRDLLGSDIYPFPEPGSEAEPQPSRYHLDRITDILGPQLLSAMALIWMSPQSVVFVNAPVASFEDFVKYVGDVGEWLPRDDEEHGPGLESLFPSPTPRIGEGLSYEEGLEWLVERRRERWGRAKAMGEMMRGVWKRREEKGVGGGVGLTVGDWS